ncbi:MAG: serine/threonine protein phosphatase [Ignavibacteriae bacterium HGW-Ignavibacteriae-3]|nr:MAG: serine/threonine protein phosphatase [Ignavibacteriae bacterium HGW-Ignavibacteriae-3]
MDQKKLYRTIESVASQKFSNEHELLADVLNQIIANEQIKFTGGRIWKLDPTKNAYRILFQVGNVQKITEDFLLHIEENPIFDKVSVERSILADETNTTLMSKGIFKYSAAGVGRKVRVGEKMYYEYMIAVNSDLIGDDLRYTLNIVATVLTSKLNETFLSRSRKNLIADIDKAKQLQRSILPAHEMKFFDYDLFGVTIPAEIVAGDFYDYLKIGDDEERLGIVVGDAASKGLGAAAEAMYISGALRMASTFQIKISPMLFRLNQLVNKIFSDDKFTTLFYGEISNDKKGLFLYANAGHNPPFFFRKKTGEVLLLDPTGPLLGPAPNSKYETDHINFKKGDILVIYSDGIVESANEKYDFYGEERLKKIIQDSVDHTPKEITSIILDDLLKFSTNDSKYQDDKTIVVIKRNG